jgi:1,4-dihydroxy-2-naphthoyl-CoA hydrolase
MFNLSEDNIWHSSNNNADKYPDMVAMDKHLGIELLEIGDDFVTTKMPVSDRTTGSIAANLVLDNSKFYAVGLEINANHITSVSNGSVYAKATALHIGKSTSVWNIDITDENNKRICFCRFTAMNKEGERE